MGFLSVAKFLAVAAMVFAVGAARADTYLPVPATNDISLTGAASAEYRFSGTPGGIVNWIAIKNNCTGDLSFGLRSTRDSTDTRFPIRLKTGESFSGPFQIFSVLASNLTGATCSFNIVPALKQ